MAHYPKIFDFTTGTPIDSCEIAWGTGGGVTSSNYFVFDCSRINLVMGGTSSLNSATNSVYLSSIIGGSCNIIKNATGSSIQASCYSCIYGNNFKRGGYSSIIAGYFNRIVSGTSSVILGGTCNLILNLPTNVDPSPGSPRGNNFITAGFSQSVCCSRESGIIGGALNVVKDSAYSTIIGGRNHISYSGSSNILIGGYENYIEGSNSTSIIGGNSNHSYQDSFSAFLGGRNNYLSLSKYSLISGFENCIVKVLTEASGSSILGGEKNKIVESNNSTVISSVFSTIERSKGSSILAGIGGQGYYKQGNTLVDSCSSILSGGKCVFDGVYWNDKVNKIYSSVSVNVIGGASNVATSSFGSTILAGYQNLICSSTQSSIIGGETNSIYQSSNSSIIGGSGSSILSSTNSAIIGGFGLTISNENDVVYVSTLKIDSVTQSVSSNRYLIWDGDKCVRYTENTTSLSLDFCEVAWGRGPGITSSNFFLFDCSGINLIMGGVTQSGVVNSATDNVFLSSIIGGSLNTITNGTSSTIFGSLGSTVTGSCYSSIIGGTSNSICEACFAVILGGTCNYNNNGNHSIISGDCNCVNGALNSSIIGGLENKLCTNANRSAIISSDCSCMIYMQGATNNIILGSCLVKFYGESIYSSSIISGKNDSIEWCTKHSSIISGSDNLLHYSNYSSIISSTGSEICQGTMSVIIGSKAFIKNSCSSIILGAIGGDLYTALPMGYYGATAGESRIVNGANNTIIGGGSYQTSGYLSCSYPNIICNSYASSVIGGRGNLICSKTGKDNYFTTQLSYSGVLLGEKNKILSGTVSSTTNHVVRNSTILGGLCNLIHSSNSDETSQSANVSFGSSIVGGRGNSIRNSSSSFISSSGYSCITATGSTNDLEFNSVISTRQGCILGVVCSNSIVASLFSGILSCNGYRIEQSLISSSKCVYICSSSSTKQSISNSVIGSYCSSLKDSRSSSLINSLRGTVSNSEDSLLASTRGSYICNSCISGIITSTVSSICNSIISTIISSSASCIKDSCNSLILGGRGLTLSNERDTVYVSTLKINSVTQSIDTNRVLVWDCDSCVRYSTINAAGVIDICEIAWGTGVGITSSDHFRFDCQRCNLLMGCNQGPTFTHASSSYWSVNLGKGCNCITNSNSAVILGGCKQLVATSSYSSIIGGQSNTIWCSNYSSTIGGKFLTITQSNYSTIINGSSSQIESVFSTIISGICQCIDTNSNYSSIVSGKCGCITTSDYSTIIGGFAGNSKNTIRNSNSSLVLNSTCYSLIGTSSCSMIANALCSKIEESKGSLILAGGCNRIVDQSYRSLIFGYRNEIDNSKDSIVLGNRNNCICINSQSSTIISGCENVIINNACDSIIIQGFDNCVANSGFKNSIFGSDLSVINTSCHSTIISSYKSCTFNTKWSGVIASSQSYICGEKSLSSCQIKSSIIVGGVQHLICNSSYSSIIGGYKNCLCESRSGSIISSINSRVLTKGGQSFLSGIITSCCGEMINSKSSTIISSWESTETCSYQSVIIASTHSGSFRNKASALLSSVDSNVNSSLSSTIVSSECSLICSATNSAIIGSSASYICISQNSAIIGGRGLTLSNENQVVYLPELKINKVDQCLTLTKFLAWDDTNKYVRWGTPGLDNGITGSTIFYTGSFWTYSSTNIYNNGIYVGIGLTNSNTNIYATPSSNLHVFGSLSLDVKTASSDYILTDRNFTLLASPPSAGMTVSLPSASLAKHRVYVIKKVNLGGFVYVARNGSDTFEGFGGSITLENQWDYYMLQSDGVNMWIKLGGAVGLNLL